MKHDFTLAGIIIVFASAFIAGAFLINEPVTTFSAVGPRAFPIMIGIGMLLSGLWLGWQTWRRQAAAFKFSDLEEIDWKTWGLTALLFLVYILIFEPVGYLISTALFLFVVARILGSRAWLRDAIVSIALSLAIYYFFNGLMKVGLPKGLLG
jgi:putative tricarboxylic transport membrane protein